MPMILKEPMRRYKTFTAGEMQHNTLYMTAQSTEGYKQVPCRLVKLLPETKTVILAAWYANLQAWFNVEVQEDYLIRNLKEEEVLKMKANIATKAAGVKTSKEVFKSTYGKTTNVGVFQTWYIAFQKFGTNPQAIVKFMKDEYPNRKTDWGKWVNSMRQRYNAGKIGTAPTEKIKPWAVKKV